MVAPSSSGEPECLRQIEVRADDNAKMWKDAVEYDGGCKNPFPVVYGARLIGKPWVYPDDAGLPESVRGKPVEQVTARPLEVGAIYTVDTTTGSTGYGCGRFRIKADRTVENLGCNS